METPEKPYRVHLIDAILNKIGRDVNGHNESWSNAVESTIKGNEDKYHSMKETHPHLSKDLEKLKDMHIDNPTLEKYTEVRMKVLVEQALKRGQGQGR